MSQFFQANSVIKVEEDCHVLPSMKQGKIIAISKTPKATGAFENYFEIQQHWKDMYGYVLPNEPKEGFWYYNVIFRIPNATPYTYPQFCVRPFRYTTIPRINPKLTLCSFIKDFSKKIGNVCGEKCRIVETRASFTNLELFPAIKISEDMKPRAGTTYVMKSNLPYRKDLPSNISNSMSNAEKSHSDELNRNSSNISVLSKSNSTPANYSYKINTGNISNKSCSTKTMNLENSNNQRSSLKVVNSEMTTGTNQIKYAPCFYPIQSKNQRGFVLQSQSTNKIASYKPTFFPNNSSKNPVSSNFQKDIYVNQKNISKDISSKKLSKTSNIRKVHGMTEKSCKKGEADKILPEKKMQQTLLNLNVKKKCLMEKKTNMTSDISNKRRKCNEVSSENPLKKGKK
ncbi:uncharacterized protein C18orf63 [Trichonephila clavipes]|nr:uncharacterized protein C18orf63 [Trichonephila clavipes]